MSNLLPTVVILFLFEGALPAHERPSATPDDPTQNDFRPFLSQAESGDR
jgi:hypothetical protein